MSSSWRRSAIVDDYEDYKEDEMVIREGSRYPKNYIADFGNFKPGFLSMKLIKRRVISGFRVCFFNNCIDIN